MLTPPRDPARAGWEGGSNTFFEPLGLLGLFGRLAFVL